MKIYYVRHGQTDLNLAKKMQGGGTEKGRPKRLRHGHSSPRPRYFQSGRQEPVE